MKTVNEQRSDTPQGGSIGNVDQGKSSQQQKQDADKNAQQAEIDEGPTILENLVAIPSFLCIFLYVVIVGIFCFIVELYCKLRDIVGKDQWR